MEKFDVIIIGAGAAGCFVAIQLKEFHPELKVLILEKSNKILAKVKVSGGGRCNVTNVLSEPAQLAKNYPRGEKFLRKLFYEFSSSDMVSWLNQNQVKLRLYDDGCYFPETNDSQTIIDLFLNLLHKYKVEIRTQQRVEELTPVNEKWLVQAGETELEAKAVVLTIGGQPKTSNFDFLTNLNLKLVPPVPSLFTFNLPNHPITQLMGIVNEETIVRLQGQKWTSKGPLLITHWGMSGPVILKASAYGARLLADKNYEAEFNLNWAGNENHEMVRAKLDELNKSGKLVVNERPDDIKSRLWDYLVERAGISKERKWNELGSKQLNKLHEILVNDTYKMQGKTTFKEEFVTAGGISLDSVKPTLESKIHAGLFFAGEVLDIDGITGGFNFQAAWTTAHVLAKHIKL